MGTNLSDVLSGMYAVRMKSVSGALFETEGFSIESEIAAHIASTSRKITEVSIKYRKRVGEKKLKVRHGLLIALDMLRLSWRYNPAFFIFATASLILTWVALEYLIYGIKHFVWAIIGTTLASTGTQALLMAIMTLYIKRVEYRIHEKTRHLYNTIQAQPQE